MKGVICVYIGLPILIKGLLWPGMIILPGDIVLAMERFKDTVYGIIDDSDLFHEFQNIDLEKL